MRFADALAEEAVDRRLGCKAASVLSTLDAEDREAFEAAVGRGFPVTALQRALRRLGRDVSYSSVQRHVNGVCHCDG